MGKITNLDKARAMKALKPHHRAFVKALLAGQSLSECARIAGSRASNPAVACVMRNRPDIAKVLKLSGYKKPEKKPKATGGAPQARVSAKSTEPPAEPATSPADPPEPHSGGLDEKLIRAEAEQLSAFAEWLNGEIVGWNTAEEARA